MTITIRKVTLWSPGGISEHLFWHEAAKRIREIITEEESHPSYWEWRTPGVDMEETWNNGGNPIKGLRQTLEYVLPNWREFGLTLEDAIILCMDLNLILSVGDGFGEDDTYASEDELLDTIS